MVTRPTDDTPGSAAATMPQRPASGEGLERQVLELRAALHEIEVERDRERRARQRQLLVVGVGISIVFHLCVMIWLATHRRAGPPGPGFGPVAVEIAFVQDETLTALDAIELDAALGEGPAVEAADSADEPVDLAPATPTAAIDASAHAAVPSLGGTGGGAAGGSLSGGGGGGASFFGVSSRGSRFAYIVDVSASMRQGRKMETALRELERSVGGLPDYASFYVVLFSSVLAEPPIQKGWARAKPATVSRLARWLGLIEPAGGTEPLPAFQRVFSLSVRPDAIFFLTDGEIPEETVEALAALNRGGERVVINTIGFGNPSSRELLERIADNSGGRYRFVAAEDAP